jgi:L-threonylcarbamoyladenylate synthase
MSRISTDIEQAASLLNNNELVAIPTETVYGLAGNIFSETSIRKIFELKQRPLFNPLIVHIHSIAQLDSFVSEIPEQAVKLAKHFWPGPLTLVLKKKASVPDLVTANKDTVAVRIPNHPVALSLLKQLPFPLAAPSANPFGRISPTTAAHVDGYFGADLKMVLDGGECQKGIESTIVGFENNEPVIYRLGSISQEELEEIIGSISVKNKSESAPAAPGMLSRHYAPMTKTILVDHLHLSIAENSNKRIGLLSFAQIIEHDAIQHAIVLSPNGNLLEAMAKLYAALHELDKKGLDLIIAEKFPETGLGKSINDRLLRATK